MTARNDDRLLSAWLHDNAPAREPEHLLGKVLARTARTRRRAAWRTPERWDFMSAITSRFAPAAPVPWRLMAVGAALFLALVLGVVLVASGALRSKAPPFGPAANGQLFFSDGGDVYVQDGPNGARRPVVTGPTQDDSPVISLDGTRMTFLRHSDADHAEIWVANLDGSNAKKLEIGGTRPGWFEWSPDARTAVVVEDAHPFRLTVASVDGPPLTRELDVAINRPIFRPGSPGQIAFLGTASGGDRGVYLVNADGTGLTLLDLDPGHQDDATYGTDKWAYFWDMSWSPTGDRILFSTLERLPASAASPGLRIHLASVDASGAVSGERMLDFDPATEDEFSPSWLPPGEGFVFENVAGERHWLATASLGADGQVAAEPLGVEANDYLGAQVSPDGRLLFTQVPRGGRTGRDPGRPGEAHVTGAAGRERRDLAARRALSSRLD